MPHPEDRNFLEAFLENMEVAADAFTGNDAVKSIPVIGTAIKLCKGLDDLRSRALAAKLTKFMTAPSLQTAGAKVRLQSKLAGNSDEQAKIGEVLFLVLDRMSDMAKPKILADIFSAYLDNVISDATLRRLAHAIDFAFIEDIESLLQQPKLPKALGTEWKQGLVAAGLARPVGGETFDNLGKVGYELTALASEFKLAYAHANRVR